MIPDEQHELARIVLQLEARMCARNRLPPCPEKTIRSHSYALAYQLRLPRSEWDRAIIKSCWKVILQYRGEPEVDSWLKNHGQRVVDFLRSKTR
jgi:hypothetical protein